jgi:hypothetical protein
MEGISRVLPPTHFKNGLDDVFFIQSVVTARNSRLQLWRNHQHSQIEQEMQPAEGWQISVIKPAARGIHLAGSRSAITAVALRSSIGLQSAAYLPFCLERCCSQDKVGHHVD